jgi:hypothetical protein
MEGGAVGHNFERDPPRDHPCQVKMATKLKIEKRGDEIFIVHCCFSISQIQLKF